MQYRDTNTVMSQNSKKNSMSHVVLSDDLIIEVLSFLKVKSLMRFKFVSKLWNTIISDHTFIKLHLQRSPKTKHIAVLTPTFSVVTFPLNHIIENLSITIPTIPYNILDSSSINDCRYIVGSCNGLICFCGYYSAAFERQNIWFRIWNPATKTISKPLGFRPGHCAKLAKCAFGYDNSTTTYKVVVLFPTEVKIFDFGDNNWRTISSFPPFDHVVTLGTSLWNVGVYLSGTVNWFAIRSNFSYQPYPDINITVDQFVIISLDLGTETYMQLSPPRVEEVPLVEPTISVLMDCLCFSYNLKGTHFVIWQMKEFGVEQSWTQFLKISSHNFPVDYIFTDWRYYRSFPLCLSENGHKLILASRETDQLIIYNLRDNRVEQTCDNEMIWSVSKNYVESLASIC